MIIQQTQKEQSSRDRAFLEYLKRVEEALKKILEQIEDQSDKIRRPNDPE